MPRSIRAVQANLDPDEAPPKTTKAADPDAEREKLLKRAFAVIAKFVEAGDRDRLALLRNKIAEVAGESLEPLPPINEVELAIEEFANEAAAESESRTR